MTRIVVISFDKEPIDIYKRFIVMEVNAFYYKEEKTIEVCCGEHVLSFNYGQIETVLDIKQFVSETLGVYINQQAMFYEGKHLFDHQKIDSIIIQEHDSQIILASTSRKQVVSDLRVPILQPYVVYLAGHNIRVLQNLAPDQFTTPQHIIAEVKKVYRMKSNNLKIYHQTRYLQPNFDLRNLFSTGVNWLYLFTENENELDMIKLMTKSIQVQTLTGRHITVPVSNVSLTVKDVKMYLEQHEKIPSELQQLMYQKIRLNDNDLLTELIGKGVLMLVILKDPI